VPTAGKKIILTKQHEATDGFLLGLFFNLEDEGDTFIETSVAF
jgi:hypothetical protein